MVAAAARDLPAGARSCHGPTQLLCPAGGCRPAAKRKRTAKKKATAEEEEEDGDGRETSAGEPPAVPKARSSKRSSRATGSSADGVAAAGGAADAGVVRGRAPRHGPMRPMRTPSLPSGVAGGSSTPRSFHTVAQPAVCRPLLRAVGPQRPLFTMLGPRPLGRAATCFATCAALASTHWLGLAGFRL